MCILKLILLSQLGSLSSESVCTASTSRRTFGSIWFPNLHGRSRKPNPHIHFMAYLHTLTHTLYTLINKYNFKLRVHI